MVVLSAIFFPLNNLKVSYCIIPILQMRKLRHQQFSKLPLDQSYLVQRTVGQSAYTVHIFVPDLYGIFKMPGIR